jgi:hypothetical protein
VSQPTYTLAEAEEAKRKLVSVIEFAFFTALSDMTDDEHPIDIGPVEGGQMHPHRERQRLIGALVERLVYDEDLVIYPVPAVEAPRDSDK